MKRVDVMGCLFDRSLVTAEAGKRGRHRQVLCLCACGNTKTVLVCNLRSGYTTSCGCAQKEATRKANATHLLTHSSEYIAWVNMKARCHNTEREDYNNYGGRGILVCQKWLDSFEAFFADMGPRPPGKSLDRKDVNGNYTPDNCQWATLIEQANNTRANRYVEIDGVTRSLKQWCDERGLSYKAIHQRIRRGATPIEALTKP